MLQTCTLTVTNSIIAGSVPGGDCLNGGSATGGHNLFDDTTGASCGLPNGINGNIFGVDPNLGPVWYNGGSTLYFEPRPGSPAINAGDYAACPLVDQRGVSRPLGGKCGIGSVEALIRPRAYLLLVQK